MTAYSRLKASWTWAKAILSFWVPEGFSPSYLIYNWRTFNSRSRLRARFKDVSPISKLMMSSKHSILSTMDRFLSLIRSLRLCTSFVILISADFTPSSRFMVILNVSPYFSVNTGPEQPHRCDRFGLLSWDSARCPTLIRDVSNIHRFHKIRYRITVESQDFGL